MPCLRSPCLFDASYRTLCTLSWLFYAYSIMSNFSELGLSFSLLSGVCIGLMNSISLSSLNAIPCFFWAMISSSLSTFRFSGSSFLISKRNSAELVLSRASSVSLRLRVSVCYYSDSAFCSEAKFSNWWTNFPVDAYSFYALGVIS